jgi:gamma-glutamylcyclotransferase (GGCT)/AIG2-like uncharacterized protein YtfP
MEIYFAYGSNLDFSQMQRRCGAQNVEKIDIGYLPDHQLAFTQYYADWGGGVADVVKSNGNKVWGIIYSLSSAALELLDGYEGFPYDYTRSKHIITASGGRTYEAWTYLAKRKDGDFIPPSAMYLDIIKHAAKNVGFPRDYIAYLNTIELAHSNFLPKS